MSGLVHIKSLLTVITISFDDEVDIKKKNGYKFV